MSDITFGTDGWRAVIADGFTFETLRKVSGAVAVASRGLEAPEGVNRNLLLVGYDRRFLSREFAGAAAEVLSDAGFEVILSDRAVPSPAVSWAIFKRKALGGLILTASHNPSKYNGIKFKQWYGGSALPETYKAIESRVGESSVRDGGSVSEQNILDSYIEAVQDRLDVNKIRDARLAILHDPIFGVGASLPSRVLGVDYVGNARIISRDVTRPELTTVDSIRGETNTSFGGVNPEPIPENMQAARNVMLTGEYDLAICNDGDADRLGILDERGNFVSPHKIIALLALYLAREKGERGDIVKTFSTSRLVEKVAKSIGSTLHETPIGFKYVADLMLTHDVLLGGEESGGIGFGRFIPERDGILSGLLVAECVAHYGRPLSDIITKMEQEFGALHYDRRDLHRPMERCAALLDRVRGGELKTAFGSDFASMEEIDGVKLNFADGTWLLFRRSGTEPMIRIYCESPDPARVPAMLEAAVSELDR